MLEDIFWKKSEKRKIDIQNEKCHKGFTCQQEDTIFCIVSTQSNLSHQTIYYRSSRSDYKVIGRSEFLFHTFVGRMAESDETDRGFDDDRNGKSNDMEWGSIGMIFEGLHPTATKGFLWETSSTSNRTLATTLLESQIEWEQRDAKCKQEAWTYYIEKKNKCDKMHELHDRNEYNQIPSVVCAVVRCIDDIPGAVASGHYIWPSALSLCDYIIANPIQHLPIRSVLELGAGCGIASIVAAQLFEETLEVVVVTDHDPTALKRANENWESSLAEHGRFCDGVNIRTKFFELEWGSKRDWKNLMECLSTESRETRQMETPISFDLVLGSDLIDRKEVVEPLFSTVNAALGKNSVIDIDNGQTANDYGVFLLSQSFAYDFETEAEIDRVCERVGLVRRIIDKELQVLNDDETSLSTDEKASVTSTNFGRIQTFGRK